ncbi:MAG TPA: bifunctional enoyl-CoA hydratase/phosphate acetyltransferase, partial [Isosphaeraceae bacterium]|nr:bifunctional enoyl-CoA hydratase/phosphate acetyltransferase [Isosphaeraceae bacterium]
MARIKDFDGLLELAREMARGRPPWRIAVSSAEDDSSLAALERARKMGLVEGILVGERAAILEIMGRLKLDPSAYTIVDVSGLDEKARAAVSLVRSGEADILMKGMTPTSIFLHPIFDREAGLSTGNFISHTGVLQVPGFDRLIIQTDGGINILPTLEQKKGIIMNSVFVAHLLGIERPKVALLSATETVHPKISSTVEARELALWAKDAVPDADVDGPLALDIAISPEAAERKGRGGEVAGQADVLVAANIEMGNAIYKALRHFAHAEGAGIVVGAACPVILTSRSDPPQEKLNSFALAVLYAGR